MILDADEQRQIHDLRDRAEKMLTPSPDRFLAGVEKYVQRLYDTLNKTRRQRNEYETALRLIAKSNSLRYARERAREALAWTPTETSGDDS